MESGWEKASFGTTAAGKPVDRYTLRNAAGMTVRLMTYGATVTELRVPDRHGQAADVVLGFDRLASYENSVHNPYFGATIGRTAFRVSGGKLTLDGHTYQLALNSPPNHLHGGTVGLSRVVWDAEPLSGVAGPAVKFSYNSPDGDQGYPGNLQVAVVYTLTARNELKIEYTATADRPTPVNLTHHSYFNLAGAGSGDALGHVLQLDTESYTPLDDNLLPLGGFAPVEGTPFDFRRPMPIGARLKTSPKVANGYDLIYPLDHFNGSLQRAATLSEPTSGRVMEVWTDQPALVLYTANYLDGNVRGKRGAVYCKNAAVCLETARFPDAVHQTKFPTTILRPGQTYRHTCVYRFATRSE